MNCRTPVVAGAIAVTVASAWIVNGVASPGGLDGTWMGYAIHSGDSTALAIHFEPEPTGLTSTLFLPALHVSGYPLGPVVRKGNELRAGPLTLLYDSTAGTLSGILPPDLVPVHSIPFRLRPAPEPPADNRPEPEAPIAAPLWTFDAGAPIWADVSAGQGTVFAADDSGRVHALDAGTGSRKWVRRLGGAIRARPTVEADVLYVPADDGLLRSLDTRTGEERWAVAIDSVITRLPQSDPKTRHDVRASAVTVAFGRLYVGTHGGRVLAIEPKSGALLWEADLGGSVLAAPSVSGDRVYAGSYGGKVVALDSATGRTVWSFDTQGAVTSTPIVSDGIVLVGSRSYDLFGLDAATGALLWNRYIWFSWIESTPAVHGGDAYVGSSDAGKLFAFDVRSGRPRWEADVHGLAWGQPVVFDNTLLLGTRGAFGGIGHRASTQARDRATGRLLWHFPIERPKVLGPYGFAGSGVLAGDRFVIAAVDGRVFAFAAKEKESGAR
jgi:outer membrane protein assembly factor BamB